MSSATPSIKTTVLARGERSPSDAAAQQPHVTTQQPMPIRSSILGLPMKYSKVAASGLPSTSGEAVQPPVVVEMPIVEDVDTTNLAATSNVPAPVAAAADSSSASASKEQWPPGAARQADTRKVEAFDTICVLALRTFVSSAKLAINPPQISLQRQTGVELAGRTIFSLFFSGYSQDDYHMLEEPIATAVKHFLCKRTLHVFRMAHKGLKSLQALYKPGETSCKNGNTFLAMKPLIDTLERATADDKNVPAEMVPLAAEMPFHDMWSADEVEALAACFRVLESAQGVMVQRWIEIIENMLATKLRA